MTTVLLAALDVIAVQISHNITRKQPQI